MRLEVFHHVSSLAKRCLLHLLHLLASHSEFSPTALQRRSTPDRAVGREGADCDLDTLKDGKKGKSGALQRKNWALHVLPPWAEAPAAAIASKCHEEYRLGMSTPCLRLKKQMHQNAQVNSPPSETLETVWKLKTGAVTAQVVLIGGQPGQPWRILRCQPCDHRLSAFQSFHRFALTICKTAV